SQIGYSDYERLFSNLLETGNSPELDLIESVIPLKGCHLLEVGCATGELLALARSRGASTIGLEISDYAAEVAKSRHGLDVRVGSLESQQFTSNTFDLVIALEVIEHVPSPITFLREISRILKPGGFVCLSTPNYRCARRWGERWMGFQMSFEHIYFFSDEVLMRMATFSALTTLLWATTGTGLWPPERAHAFSVRNIVKKIPGITKIWRSLGKPLKKNPWEFFGQGHRSIFIMRKLQKFDQARKN
ncbi:MAG: class I SAM-dependent methyltransferase, partial [Candidatus Helarchaeota archaeon]|nr:class I SAM-dependent methyltransferase [Candidatus Helarchaeota archaeon]